MKRHIFTYLLILLTASCSQKLSVPESYGSLDLTVSSEIKVEVQTKSGGIYDLYNIYISGVHTGNDPYSLNLVYGDVVWPFTLPYGLYTIEAESCTADQAHSANDNFGCARFWGEKKGIQIKSPTSLPTGVSVTCTMVNAKVSVIFDEGFLGDFEDVRVELKVSDRNVQVTSSQAPDVSTYFNVDQTNGSIMTYTVYGTVDEVELQYSSNILLHGAKHAHLTFKSNHNGVLGPQISVDKEIGTNEIEGAVVPGSGSEVVGGDVEKPVIYVDYEIKDAVEVITVIDVIDKEDMTL